MDFSPITMRSHRCLQILDVTYWNHEIQSQLPHGNCLPHERIGMDIPPWVLSPIHPHFHTNASVMPPPLRLT